RFWFSLPNPYVTQLPKLGRGRRASPQFMSMSDGSWLGTSACMERMTQMSSMHSATCGKMSLTSMALLAYLFNLKGERQAVPVRLSVRRLALGSALPCHMVSMGLGSNVSTCDGPPFMNRWMTRLALGVKCGLRGASG